MATWEDQTSPLSTFEDSPAESFLSTPGEMYPSLFAASTPTAPSTINPLEMMTPPPSMADDIKQDPDAALVSALATTVSSPSTPSTPSAAASKAAAGERKAAKKRKSWGQVLPEPKTNLPPRKRAKTEDEKEQRRVERVLRNRRAAQSSRERKRQEVDALEQRNQELEARLLSVEKYNIKLLDELRLFRQNSGVVTRTTTPFDKLHSDSVTLSKELFSSQDGQQARLLEPSPLADSLDLEETSYTTVDPSSLSPKPTTTETTDAAPEAAVDGGVTSADASSTDLTQHPAEMLYDLQCQQSVDLPRALAASTSNSALQMLILITSLASMCQRPLTQIALSLKAGFSLRETRSILRTIIWVVTRPASTRSTGSTKSCSTSTKTETRIPTPSPSTAPHSRRNPTSATRSSTLRMHSLRKLLTCSPNLARPLKDATMEALRLAASKRCDDGVGKQETREDEPLSEEWLEGFQLPSSEVLLTLLWALECESRKTRSNQSSCDPVTNICPSTTAMTNCMDNSSICSFKVVPGKRKREGVNLFAELREEKRQRRD